MGNRKKMDKLIDDMVNKIEELWHIMCAHRNRIKALEKATGIGNDEAGYYQVWLNCANCRVAVQVNIPRGTSVTQYRRDTRHKCPKCGCKVAK